MSILQAIRFYFRYFRIPLKQFVVFMGMFMVKHTMFLIPPLVVRHIIDVSIPEKKLVEIYACVGFIALTGTINFFIHRAYVTRLATYTKSASRNLRNHLIQKLQFVPFQFHIKNGAGKMYSKLMVDVDRTERFSVIVFNGFIGAIYTFIFSSVALLIANAWVAIIFFLTVPVYLLIHRCFKGKFQVLQHDARLANESLSRSIAQFIETNTLSRIHGEEDYEQKKIDRDNLAVIERYRDIQRSSASFGALISITSEFFLILIIAISAHFIVNDWMKLGALVLFMQYIRLMIQALTMVLNEIPEITAFSESIRSIKEIIEVKDEEVNENGLTLASLRGEIEFLQVYFRHEGQNKDLFKGLSVHIKSGETVALVGASGSGKTTFVNLALGLFRPTGGSLRLDGHDLKDLNMRKIRKDIGVVTQQPVILRGSVYENIAYGQWVIDKALVIKAAQMANAHEFIEKLPQGYDSDLGEQGGILSGGQRQRIAIARSIYRRPHLLILDEATSSLDPEAEVEVQKGIDALLGQQTTLVIAHRLSTIFKADRILVFKDGCIVEEGTHNELIDRAGIYAHFLKTQMGILNLDLMGVKSS